MQVAGTSQTSVTLVNITSSRLAGNSASATVATASGMGGAVYLDGSVVAMTGNMFEDNVANKFGGAVYYGHQCFNSSPAEGVLQWSCAVFARQCAVSCLSAYMGCHDRDHYTTADQLCTNV